MNPRTVCTLEFVGFGTADKKQSTLYASVKSWQTESNFYQKENGGFQQLLWNLEKNSRVFKKISGTNSKARGLIFWIRARHIHISSILTHVKTNIAKSI